MAVLVVEKDTIPVLAKGMEIRQQLHLPKEMMAGLQYLLAPLADMVVEEEEQVRLVQTPPHLLVVLAEMEQPQRFQELQSLMLVGEAAEPILAMLVLVALAEEVMVQLLEVLGTLELLILAEVVVVPQVIPAFQQYQTPMQVAQAAQAS
jgi:acyl-coenzyme A synthetase/AMP-(fatty) acid ligase